MVKLLTLLLIILLAITSAAGYIFLTDKIISGERKISGGQSLLDKGQLELDAGKARLEAGKQELAEGKKEYEKAHDNKFMVFFDNLLNSGKGFEEGRDQIAEGDKKVAKGEEKINVGEERLDTGKLDMEEGEDQLRLGKDVRAACGLGAVFFGILSIVLGFLWRRSLARIFKHSDT
jgi:predicted  nucleic acid-binding Zn-ribbon protein